MEQSHSVAAGHEEPVTNSSQYFRWSLLIVLFVAAMFIQGLLTKEYKGIPVFWIAGSIFLASLLTFPLSWWWKITMLQLILQLPFQLSNSPSFFLSATVASTLGPLSSAFLFRKINKGIFRISSPVELGRALIAILSGSLLSTLLILLLNTAVRIPFQGILCTLMAPIPADLLFMFMFSIQIKRIQPDKRSLLRERILFFGLVPVVSLIVFGVHWTISYRIEYHYLLFPLFFIMAMRLSGRETLAVLLPVLLLILYVSAKTPIWSAGITTSNEFQVILSIQFFFLVLITGTITGSIFHARNMQALELITSKEELYKTLVENLPQQIFLKDEHRQYISGNAAFIEQLGIEEEKLAGKTDRDLFHSSLHEILENSDNLVLRERMTTENDLTFPAPDGKERIVRMLKTPVLNFQGTAVSILGIYWDITELREAEHKIRQLNESLERRVAERTRELEETLEKLREREKALRYSEERFRSLVDQSPISIAIYSTEGLLLQANPSWKKLWGYEATNHLIGNYTLFQDNLKLQYMHEDAFKKALQGIQSLVPETSIEQANGTPGRKKFIRSFIYPIQNLQNKVTSVVITHEDISRQKQAEDVLQSALQLGRSIHRVTIDEILQKGLDEAVRISNSQIGFFHFVEPDENELSLQAWSTGTFRLCNAIGEKMHYPIQQAGVWVDAVHQRKPLIHNRLADLPHRKGLPQGHCEVIREMVIPVFQEDRIVAIMGVGNKPEDYDDFDLDQMSFFARQIWNLIEMKRAEENLRKSEDLYKSLVETIPESVMTLDREGKIIYASGRTADYIGYQGTEMISGQFFSSFADPSDAGKIRSLINPNLPPQATLKANIRFRRKDGSIIPAEISATKLHTLPDSPAEFIVTARDISDRINAEMALQESEERYRYFFSENHAIMLLVHPETGMIVDANPAACEFYGYTSEELTSRNVIEISVLPEEEVWQQLRESRENQKSHFYSRHQLSWEEIRDVDVYAGLFRIRETDLLYFIIHDDTERRRGEEQLRKLAKTQTVLLREVNHRVKNNLAALISMLHIEEDRAENSGNSSYILLLRDLISRIKGLSTVHSLLSARNWQPLEVSHLAEQIIKSCTDSIPPNKTVSVKVENSPIVVSSNQAHHLAMVLNEMTTNTLKHALKEWDETSIQVTFFNQDRTIHIHYSDDGPGFPEAMIQGDFSKINVGFELIRGIVQHSLNGKLKISNRQGAHIDIQFVSELV